MRFKPFPLSKRDVLGSLARILREIPAHTEPLFGLPSRKCLEQFHPCLQHFGAECSALAVVDGGLNPGANVCQRCQLLSCLFTCCLTLIRGVNSSASLKRAEIPPRHPFDRPRTPHKLLYCNRGTSIHQRFKQPISAIKEILARLLQQGLPPPLLCMRCQPTLQQRLLPWAHLCKRHEGCIALARAAPIFGDGDNGHGAGAEQSLSPA